MEPAPAAVSIFPCARGFNRSARGDIPNEASRHVLHGIEDLTRTVTGRPEPGMQHGVVVRIAQRQVIGMATDAGGIGCCERPLHWRQAHRIRCLPGQARAKRDLQVFRSGQRTRGLHQRTLAAFCGSKRRPVRTVAQTTFTRVIASGRSAAKARW